MSQSLAAAAFGCIITIKCERTVRVIRILFMVVIKYNFIYGGNGIYLDLMYCRTIVSQDGYVNLLHPTVLTDIHSLYIIAIYNRQQLFQVLAKIDGNKLIVEDDKDRS